MTSPRWSSLDFPPLRLLHGVLVTPTVRAGVAITSEAIVGLQACIDFADATPHPATWRLL